MQETDSGAVSFRAVNEQYAKDNPSYLQKSEVLTRLGSIVEIDRFIEMTQSIHDVRAEATQAKAKAIANEFTRTFFKGDTSVNPLAFDGLDKRLIPEQVADAQGFELHTGLIHQVIDLVQGGADAIFMNKRTRRKLNQLFMAQRAFIQHDQDAFGRPIQFFGDVRIGVVEDAFIPDNSIYAVAFGADKGITGIQAGELIAEDNGLRGNLYETLIEWYVSIVDANPKGIAKLNNFSL